MLRYASAKMGRCEIQGKTCDSIGRPERMRFEMTRSTFAGGDFVRHVIINPGNCLQERRDESAANPAGLRRRRRGYWLSPNSTHGGCKDNANHVKKRLQGLVRYKKSDAGAIVCCVKAH